MLEIASLHATTAGKPILDGFSLSINLGDVHAIIRPNDAGEVTCRVMAGRAS